MFLTNFLIIYQRKEYSFVRHWRTMFDISQEAPATKEGMSSLVCLKEWTESPSCIFTEGLNVESSAAVDLMMLGEVGLDCFGII